jgi:hypothetical protein
VRWPCLPALEFSRDAGNQERQNEAPFCSILCAAPKTDRAATTLRERVRRLEFWIGLFMMIRRLLNVTTHFFPRHLPF